MLYGIQKCSLGYETHAKSVLSVEWIEILFSYGKKLWLETDTLSILFFFRIPSFPYFVFKCKTFYQTKDVWVNLSISIDENILMDFVVFLKFYSASFFHTHIQVYLRLLPYTHTHRHPYTRRYTEINTNVDKRIYTYNKHTDTHRHA